MFSWTRERRAEMITDGLAMTKLSDRLNNDEFRLYMEPVALAAVEGVLNSDANLLAYYREKMLLIDGNQTYEDITWWLTQRSLTKFRVTAKSISCITYFRDSFERIERDWIITNSFGHDIHPEPVTIHMRQGKKTVLAVPIEFERGQPKQFQELVSLLV